MTGASETAAPGRATRWALAALLVAVAAVYVPALDGPFVYDDRIEVVGNPTIRVLSEPAAVLGYNLGRPLLALSYALDWELGGLAPRGYHLVNLALHLVATVLAWRLFRRVLGDDVRALLGAALWGLHPMGTESVAYISGRSDLLCGVGWLVALEGWIAGTATPPAPRNVADGAPDARRRPRWRTRTVIGILVAVGAKEVGLVLPLVLLAMDRVHGVRRDRRLLVASCLLVAGLIVARLAWRGMPAPETERGLGLHVLSQGEAWARYLRLWLVPWRQSVLHDLVPDAGRGALGWACVGGAALALTWTRARTSPADDTKNAGEKRRGAALALAGVLFVAPLVVSSALPLKEVMAEHRAYLAGLGVVLAAVALLPTGGVQWAFALAPILALATLARARVWSDEVLLWRDAAAANPASVDATYALGDALRLAGRGDEAEGAYRAVLARAPTHPDARINLGIVRAEAGDATEARALWRSVLRDDPRACAAHNNLATVDFREGKVLEAIAGWQSTLRACPDDLLAHVELGTAYAAQGDARRGAFHLRAFLARAPASHGRRPAVERDLARLAAAAGVGAE